MKKTVDLSVALRADGGPRRTIGRSSSLRGDSARRRTVRFFTLGCKVNQYDTQGIREHFLSQGFWEQKNGVPSDVCLINTCTVTSRADRQSKYAIRRAIRVNPAARIIVTGCLAQKDASAIADIRGVDFIIGKRFLGSALISDFKGHTRAFLKVQDGCNNRCSYCKVPLVRGNSRSRALSDIIKEAEGLVKSGFKEIVLCGICLGSFGKDLDPKPDLVDIIQSLEKIRGLRRLRLSSIEANDISGDLIKKMANSKILCRHLHIPMQSGDDAILKKMNRSYHRRDYLQLVKRIKKEIPALSVTTDIMVGFPGENEKNFSNTIGLVSEIMPLRVHIFPYSPRELTSAAKYTDILSPRIKQERFARLKEAAGDSSMAFRKQFLNKNIEVLIEEPCGDKAGFWQGYTDNYIRVLVRSRRDLRNRLLKVKLKTIEEDFMVGQI